MDPLKLVFLVGGIVGVFHSSLIAQPAKSVPHSQLAVDVVSLKSGKSVRGAFVSADASGITIVVSRDWMQQALPEMYRKAADDEASLQKQGAEQLQSQLKKELETDRNDPRLKFFLKSELERIESTLNGARPTEPSQFLWMSLTQNSISKTSRATPDRQRLAAWAWSESLPHVETRDAHDLERELKQRHIDLKATPPDLSAQLPPRLQDDREWAARMAIVEYTLGTSVDFQGTSDVLIRVTEERKGIDFATILSKMMRSQLDSLLKDLTSDLNPGTPNSAAGDWLKSAAQQADQDLARGLRATQVVVTSDGRQAIVQTTFAARMPDKTWEVIWSRRETRDATVPRANLEEKILGDPQVKHLLNTVASTGLNASDQLQQAIRFGAATMEAQQAADAQFFLFRDRYTKRLDGPPLTWSK